MTSEPLDEKAEDRRGIEKRELPYNLQHRLEAYWRGVLDRVKEQSEGRQS